MSYDLHCFTPLEYELDHELMRTKLAKFEPYFGKMSINGYDCMPRCRAVLGACCTLGTESSARRKTAITIGSSAEYKSHNSKQECRLLRHAHFVVATTTSSSSSSASKCRVPSPRFCHPSLIASIACGPTLWTRCPSAYPSWA